MKILLNFSNWGKLAKSFPQNTLLPVKETIENFLKKIGNKRLIEVEGHPFDPRMIANVNNIPAWKI